MNKKQFSEYLHKPNDFDLRQMFHLHVETLLAGSTVRKSDRIYLDAYMKDKHNYTFKNQAEMVIRNIFERRI